MGLDINDSELGEKGVILDTIFASKALTFCQQTVTELVRYDAFFEQLFQNPVKTTKLKSEVSSLNELKNCV